MGLSKQRNYPRQKGGPPWKLIFSLLSLLIGGFTPFPGLDNTIFEALISFSSDAGIQINSNSAYVEPTVGDCLAEKQDSPTGFKDYDTLSLDQKYACQGIPLPPPPDDTDVPAEIAQEVTRMSADYGIYRPGVGLSCEKKYLIFFTRSGFAGLWVSSENKIYICIKNSAVVKTQIGTIRHEVGHVVCFTLKPIENYVGYETCADKVFVDYSFSKGDIRLLQDWGVGRGDEYTWGENYAAQKAKELRDRGF